MQMKLQIVFLCATLAVKMSLAEVLITTGTMHSCAYEPDECSTPVCWGMNFEGQADAPAGPFKSMSAGKRHTCAIRSDTKKAVCWGRNDDGESDPPQDTIFSDVSCGFYHCCGLHFDNSTAICWGHNQRGQSNAPRDKVFKQVRAGAYHSCGVGEDGSITCWGGNSFEALEAPVGSFSYITLGFYFGCAIDAASGAATCWGRDVVPKTLPGNFKQLSAGYTHVCGLHANTTGSVSCWGSDGAGVMVAPTESDIENLGTCPSGLHTCAYSRSRGIVCWGRENKGESATVPPIYMCADANRRESMFSEALECEADEQTCLVVPGSTFVVTGSEDKSDCKKTATSGDYYFKVDKATCGYSRRYSDQDQSVYDDTVTLMVTHDAARDEATTGSRIQCSCRRTLEDGEFRPSVTEEASTSSSANSSESTDVVDGANTLGAGGALLLVFAAMAASAWSF